MTVLEIESSHSEGTPEEQAEKVYQRKLKRRIPVRQHRSQTAVVHRSHAMPLVYIVAGRGRSASHNSMAPVTKMVGKITSLIAVQPNFSSNWPEENELSAMLPKIRKSLNA